MNALRRAGELASPWLVAGIVAALAFTLLNALFLGKAVAQTTQTAPAAVASGVASVAAPVAAPVASPVASPVFGLFQGMLGLVVVIALIFAAGWLLKKIGPRARATGAVHVVGGASVGPREKVVVVRFGDRTLLLGVAPGHVSLLHMADASELPGAVDATVADGPATPRFADRLRAARGGA